MAPQEITRRVGVCTIRAKIISTRLQDAEGRTRLRHGEDTSLLSPSGTPWADREYEVSVTLWHGAWCRDTYRGRLTGRLLSAVVEEMDPEACTDLDNTFAEFRRAIRECRRTAAYLLRPYPI